MTQVRLSSKYQIVIPQEAREALGFQPGQLFDVFAIEGSLHVVPVRELSELFGSLPGLDTTVPRDDEDRV